MLWNGGSTCFPRTMGVRLSTRNMPGLARGQVVCGVREKLTSEILIVQSDPSFSRVMGLHPRLHMAQYGERHVTRNGVRLTAFGDLAGRDSAVVVIDLPIDL